MTSGHFRNEREKVPDIYFPTDPYQLRNVSKALAPYPQEARDTFVKPDEWVDVYGDYLFRYAFARLRMASVAEEVVQDTFLAALRHLDRFDRRGPQSAWLLGILKRKIIDTIRERAKLQRIELHDPQNIDENYVELGGRLVPDPALAQDRELDLVASEIWQAVRDCLAALTQAQADVFVLSVMEQLSADFICEELAISREVMWVRLHRARVKLARCVSRKVDWVQESADE